jgi:membrane protease YdiL (CAAX protease family)
MADIPPPAPPPESPAPAQPDLGHRIFFNSAEIRPGWRLLLFVALIVVISFALIQLGRLANRPKAAPITEISTRFLLVGEGIRFLVVLLATFLMARFEARPMRVFGLGFHCGFGRNFWTGTLWGFGALSVLLVVLRASHAFYYGHVVLHGVQIIKYAILLGIGFVLVGLGEEYTLRGYPQFTLTTGMGFWPAAVVTSAIFTWLHTGNPGENPLGLFQVFLVGMFFCLTLRRTGTLWFAVGFHAGWDWGQSYFYGTPDSGLLAHGRLLASSHAGPVWLSGGSVGPEGSALTVVLYALVVVLFHFVYRKDAVYPDPEGIKTPTLREVAPQIV